VSPGDAQFAPRPDLPHPDLAQELALTPPAFNQKYRRSPVLRARRRGYLRNIAVSLGNSGDPAGFPALETTLETEGEPLVRAHAAWALGRLGSSSARDALLKALETETDPEVRQEIESSLSSCHNTAKCW